MNRIKKPAGGQPTGKTEGGKNEQVSSPNCSIVHNHLQPLIDQASRLMSEAEARRDFDAWSAHWFIWLSLHSQKYGLPWGVKNG